MSYITESSQKNVLYVLFSKSLRGNVTCIQLLLFTEIYLGQSFSGMSEIYLKT